MAKKPDKRDEFQEFLDWLPKPYDELTPAEYDDYFREWAERRRRRRQSVLRAAQRTAHTRDRERRARAHRLITLGAEVEASGLADALKHDPDAVFGAASIFARNVVAKPELAERAAAIGHSRDVVRTSPAWTRKGRSKPSTERWRITFTAAPPPIVREALRGEGFKWRLGLRAWVGEVLSEPLRDLVTGAGATVIDTAKLRRDDRP